MPPRKSRAPQKRSYLAIHDMERLGINPIEYLHEVFQESLKAFKDGRGYSDKGDAGAAYLGVAAKCASDLAKFKHPTLSAIALKDMSQSEEGDDKAITTIEAVRILQADPFASEQMKQIDTKRVIEAMESTIEKPTLPKGEK